MNHSHHSASVNQDPSEKDCPSCHVGHEKADWLLRISGTIVLVSYFWYLFRKFIDWEIPYMPDFSLSVFELFNKMWWGLAIGILLVGILITIPQDFVMKILGKGKTFSGIFRAVLGGVLLDLCSHGILLVGMQLYRRGASLGQTMAFLIASPWNSISLTLVLWALVGFKWMMAFLLLSLLIALISGLFFEYLVSKKVLPANPNTKELPDDFHFWKEARKSWKNFTFSRSFFSGFVRSAWHESRMILRWIFLGVVLASLMRTFIPPESFQTLFGPTLLGLGLTIVVATILEVCSEGSTPIAADILTRAAAPGNAFGFLMTGVSTDYTEIASLKETTGSWKIAFFLPLVTLPQILLLAWILNQI